MNDALGDRMKLYENVEAGRRLMPLLPALARLDGRAFHSFTNDMQRPYDKRLSGSMISLTRMLVEETGALCGYTQSDEITLAWCAPDFKSQIFFDGRVQKMTSCLASLTTALFHQLIPDEWRRQLPTFDCRVWNVPNLTEAANTFLWREHDATKNSVQMAARHYYSHVELMNKDGRELQDMLWQKGVNWSDYPASFKRGTYVLRRKVMRPFTAAEITCLPLQHEARQNPDLMVERSSVTIAELPPLASIPNRVEVLFSGAEPQKESV